VATTDFSRVVNTTIETYLREVEVDILRNRKLLAMLEAQGRISTGWGGDEVKWPIRYKRAIPSGFDMGDTQSFSQKDRWKTGVLPWRGYAVGDSITKKERLQNKGINAIVEVFTEMTDNLLDDMRENFCDELYIDGNATGNSKRIHGIESFMGDDSGAAAGTKYVTPDDDYAGISTAPGDYGGSWTGTWPSGSGSAHYDFYSPTLINWSSTAWVGSGSTTFDLTGEKALRQGIIWAQRNKSANGRLNMILMDADMYAALLALYAAKERINVQRGEGTSLVSLGFTDVINFEGTEVTWEYGVPANTGYGFNVQQMGLRSLQDQMFVAEGPDYDIASKSWRFSVDFFGNAWFRPRYFARWENYA